jgi:hypothetical protein
VGAEEERQLTTGDEARTALSRVLLERIRKDDHPSVAQMDILEETIPPQLVREYLSILLEKTLADRWPSIPMLRRISRAAQRL